MAKRNSKPEELLNLYERMITIRFVETRLGELFSEGKIPGFIHVSIGQEAIAVGVASALDIEDTLASTHRGHGHALAKGMSPEALMQEILGHAEGACQGRGGSLHVADFSVGMLGANGIVGAGIPIALGSALAHKTQANGRVAVVFFGDGALGQGLLYESLNMAKLWMLPLLFVCENNGWSEFTPTSLQQAGNLRALAESFGIVHRQVDGNNVEEVANAARLMVEDLRGGNGPVVLECITSRVKGHYEGDPQPYRKGIDEPRRHEPIEFVLSRLQKEGFSQTDVEKVTNRVRQLVETATASALAGHEPSFEAALADVYGRA
jgi:pyruvate dehydrogenase E1 component alpha subunit